MSQQVFNLGAFLLISAMVVHFALPFTNGVIGSLPDAHGSTGILTFSNFTSEAQMPSFAANDPSRPAEHPEVQPQTEAHGLTTTTVWGLMLVTLSLLALFLRSPRAISAERSATSTDALRIWRPPMPSFSSL